MPTVRKRRSRKNSRINNTRYGNRLKKRSSKDVKNRIQLDCIKQRWDSKKTMKQNLMELGLSSNPNRSLPIRQPENYSSAALDSDQMTGVERREEQPQTVHSVEDTDLIAELEAIAAHPPPTKQFLMSPAEAKFIAYLITKHGTIYKKMVRDKKNYNQLTEGQLKKKCLQFHKSPYVYLLDSDDSSVEYPTTTTTELP